MERAAAAWHASLGARHLVRLLPFVVLLGAALGPTRSADADALDTKLAEARAAYVKQLETLVAWCGNNKVFAERDRTYQAILRLAPDHAQARAGLKYRRSKKDAPWVQDPEWKPSKNWNLAMVPDAQKRLKEAAFPYRDAVLAALEAEGERLPTGRRELEVETLLDLVPDDAELHRWRGDVQKDGSWMQAETALALARLADLSALVTKAAQTAPPPQLDGAARAKGWTGAAKTARFTVLGLVTQAECEDLLRLLETSNAVLPQLLSADEHAARPRNFVLMAEREQAQAWLADQGADYAEARRQFPQVSGLWLPNSGLLAYWSDVGRRAAGSLRQLVDQELRVRHEGRDRGWVQEGVGQRLCWHLAGRHGPEFVHLGGTETDAGEALALPAQTASWMAAAAKALETEPERRLRTVLTMRTNAMDARDVLVSYALASFLIEARPDDLTDMLKATMSLDDADAQVREALGVELESLAWRVRRFAMEMAAHEGRR